MLLDLHDLILEQILMHLPDAEQLVKVQLVCKQLKDVASSPTLWLAKLHSEFGISLKVGSKGLPTDPSNS